MKCFLMYEIWRLCVPVPFDLDLQKRILNYFCQYKTYSHLNTFCQILELAVGGGGLFKKGLWCEIKAAKA